MHGTLPDPMRFFRIAFSLTSEGPERVTYVRARDEDNARNKLYDRFTDEPERPNVISIEQAEGEFITD